MQLSLSDWRKMRNPRLSSGTRICCSPDMELKELQGGKEKTFGMI
jgi:hypothetical protein